MPIEETREAKISTIKVMYKSMKKLSLLGSGEGNHLKYWFFFISGNASITSNNCEKVDVEKE